MNDADVQHLIWFISGSYSIQLKVVSLVNREGLEHTLNKFHIFTSDVHLVNAIGGKRRD